MKYPKNLFIIVFLHICLSIFAVNAAKEGTLTVTSDPEGVEVWLDDKYIGDTPIKNKKLRTGKYSIKLIDPIQQVSITEEILIQPSKLTVVEKILKKKFGTLKVDSDPEGAEVFISTSLGKTPLENNFMNPGKYRIELKHPKKKYKPLIENITIPQGKKIELSNTLAKHSTFDKKDLIRLLLGVGAIGGFVWAIVAQGNHKEYDNEVYHLSTPYDPVNEGEIKKFEDRSKSSANQRTLGIIVGSLCVVGFEIIAFF